MGSTGRGRMGSADGQAAEVESPSQQLLDVLERHGYDFFTGVPCSLFEGVTRILDRDPRYGYISAVREDSAIGIAAGAHFGGRQPVVLMQNSGLGVSLNAIVSLNQIYDIPALLIVSWRGEGGHDAPEHLVMGAVMEPLMTLLQVPYTTFNPATIDADVATLTTTLRRTKRPVALVVSRGMLQR